MLSNARNGDNLVGSHVFLYLTAILLITKILQDYEYASFNPVAFDIANHFCEMAADYHTATPHVLDFTKYPG